MKGPCAKQRVIATIVTPSGEEFVGENACLNAQIVCPRADMPSGVGYHLCQEVCKQVAHAEVAALREAGTKARGATLYLSGHTYVCDDCKAAMERADIKQTIICEVAS